MRCHALLTWSAGALLVALSPALPTFSGDGELLAQVKHNCSFCHNLHGGSYSQLTNYAVVEDLCYSCHSDAGPAQVNRDGTMVNVPKGPYSPHNGSKHTSPTGCWACHNHEAEAGGNLAMVQANLPTPNSGTLAVVFTARTGLNSFADSVPPINGVCEVCHTATNHHRNTTGWEGYHNAKADCTACHKHSGGFAPAGGCSACHKTAQAGRRAIIPEFERTTHHVNWSISADSISDAVCQICHDQAQHQSGQVRLKNADAPATIYTLAADPYSSATEAAKLSAFCLSCHDSNGANGNLTPFGDGTTRPLIDVTAWNAASHKTSPLIAGCFGNGTFGCHASGHGSQKRNMLAAPTVAATAPALSEEQEGFCLNCHDSNGPSAINIASLFAAPINWVQTGTGLNNDPNLNDRHDIQYAAQSRSGAKIECTDCHNPHVANARLPYVQDPDPTDGHVPGTNWYFYSATADTLSEFCLDCHDGTFPAGVLDHASPQITNIRTTWTNDGMGARVSSNINVRAGTGWGIGDMLPCRVCHSAHPTLDKDIGPAPGTPTLFSVIDTVKSKTGAYLPFIDRGINTFVYGITNDTTSSGVTSGAYWCNTCHDRTAMVGKSNCFSCHHHGDGGRF